MACGFCPAGWVLGVADGPNAGLVVTVGSAGGGVSVVASVKIISVPGPEVLAASTVAARTVMLFVDGVGLAAGLS